MLDGAGGARMGLTSARAPSRRSDRQSSILARSFGQKTSIPAGREIAIIRSRTKGK